MSGKPNKSSTPKREDKSVISLTDSNSRLPSRPQLPPVPAANSATAAKKSSTDKTQNKAKKKSADSVRTRQKKTKSQPPPDSKKKKSDERASKGKEVAAKPKTASGGRSARDGHKPVDIKSKDKRSDKKRSSSKRAKHHHRCSKDKPGSGGRHGHQHNCHRHRANKQKSKPAALPSADRADIDRHVRRIINAAGSTVVRNEEAINVERHYVIDKSRAISKTDFSSVFRAKRVVKDANARGTDESPLLAVKIIQLSECSTRLRTNLLKTSVRIVRYISSGGESGGPLAPLFVRTYDVFQVGNAQLYLFMDECNNDRLLYDLVKAPQQQLAPSIVRRWCRAIANGVAELYRQGIAHRSIKLQHIAFDLTAECNPKLIGWSRSVLFYDSHNRRILLQSTERRARHNYHLPPEAFIGSYDPSKADVWSIAVILVCMCTKRYPFLTSIKTKFSTQWRAFVQKNALNVHVRKFCNRIFSIDPLARPSAADMFKHKYLMVADEELVPTTLKVSSTIERESSRVGAMSDVDKPTDKEKAAAAVVTALQPLKTPTSEILDDKSTKQSSAITEPQKQSKSDASTTNVPSGLLPTANNNKGAEEDHLEEVEEESPATDKEVEDKSGTEDTATGMEGGGVGEEDAVEEKQAGEHQKSDATEQEEEGETEDDGSVESTSTAAGGGSAASSAIADEGVPIVTSVDVDSEPTPPDATSSSKSEASKEASSSTKGPADSNKKAD